MKHNKYPTEVICKFIGDIKSVPEFSKLYQENLGIYKVKVKAPDIKHPLLPVKINNTVVFGSGDWTGTYFSEEIKKTVKNTATNLKLKEDIYSNLKICSKTILNPLTLLN